MTKPGHWIRRWAERICSANTMERLVEPIVADLQIEHAKAIAEGRRWRARGIVIAGYVAFGKAVVLHGCEVLASPSEWPEDDRRVLARSLKIGTAATVVATALLTIPPMIGGRVSGVNAQAVLYVIPQALPLALPIGIVLGVILGLRGRVAVGRVGLVVALASVLSSTVSLAALNSLIPAANQAFRKTVFAERPLTRGLNEMTLGELRRQMRGEQVPDFGFPLDPSATSVSYHFRWALSSASLAFAVFALVMVTRRTLKRWAALLCAIGACAGYYEVLYVARGLGLDGRLSPVASAWLANVTLIVVAGAVLAWGGWNSSLDHGGEPTTS